MSERGTDVERWLEEYLGSTFVADFVLRSPRHLDRGLLKETCDHLIEHRGRGIVVQLKAQGSTGHPKQPSREGKWAQKAADKACRQAKGAFSCLDAKTIHIDHARRGPFSIPPRTLDVRHGLALIELQSLDQLPITAGVQTRDRCIHFLTPSDLLNLAEELVTIPDLFDYLDQREKLLDTLQPELGSELGYLAWYLTTACSFAGLSAAQDAKNAGDALFGDGHAHYVARRTADQASKLYSRIIDQVHWIDPDYSFAGPDADDEHWSYARAKQQYIEIAYELNSLRRLQRRNVTRRIQAKAKLAEKSDRPHFFVVSDHESNTALAFITSRKRTDSDRRFMQNLALLAIHHLRKQGLPTTKCVAVLLPSLTRPDQGLDYLLIEPGDPDTVSNPEFADELFEPLDHLEETEFPTGIESESMDAPLIRANWIAVARRMKLGRNDPCPCGSGRKLKKCHGGTSPPG